MRRGQLQRIAVAAGATTVISTAILFATYETNTLLVGSLLTTSLVPVVAYVAARRHAPGEYMRIGIGLVLATSLCIGTATALRPDEADREVVNGFAGFILMFAIFLGISSLLLALVGVLRDGSGSPADE